MSYDTKILLPMRLFESINLKALNVSLNGLIEAADCPAFVCALLCLFLNVYTKAEFFF